MFKESIISEKSAKTDNGVTEEFDYLTDEDKVKSRGQIDKHLAEKDVQTSF